MEKKIVLFLCVFFFISLVSAVKPEPQIISNGCEIRLPQAIILKQNQDISFHTHVINTTTGASNFLTNETTTCFVHLYNHSGHTLQKNMSWDLNGLEWKIDILGGNFSQIGEFVFYIQCQAAGVICADAGTFEVTPTGKESFSSGEGMVFIVSLASMFLMSMLFFFLSNSFKENPAAMSGSKEALGNPAAQFALVGLSFIIGVIAVLYSSVALMTTLGGFEGIISGYSTFLYVILSVLFLLFIFILINLTIRTIEAMRIKRGLKE